MQTALQIYFVAMATHLGLGYTLVLSHKSIALYNMKH